MAQVVHSTFELGAKKIERCTEKMSFAQAILTDRCKCNGMMGLGCEKGCGKNVGNCV